MYAGLMAHHNMNPAKGAYLCPITRTTRTLADARFIWIVGGKTYRFCCPPCISEFVKGAKAHPHDLRPPSAYVKQ